MREIIGNGAFVYMDDIIVYSKTLDDHIQILESIFKRFLEHIMKLKFDKSKFLIPKVKYLGFIISSEGLQMDPKKVECILNYPRPQNVKQTQSFLGMCNYYRRYISHFAGIAKPLYELCKKEVEFIWSDECQLSFDKFKTLLSELSILIYPSFKNTFIGHTDCLLISASAVLSEGEIPFDKPIQYFSKTLNPAQTRYSTIEKELLAIILAVENFHYYLIGREFMM